MNVFCDIGNTFTKLVMSTKNRLRYKLLHTEDFLKLVKKFANANYYISCVVTEIEKKLKKITKNVKFITHKDIEDLIKIKYDKQNIGVDRLLSTFAAKKLFGNNILVVSCGTAVVVDYVNEKGMFVGGEIFLGITPMLKSLSCYTSKLPLVTKQQLLHKCKTFDVVGNNTIDCIIKGVVNFYNSGIKNLIKIVKPRKVVFTGGDADFFIKFYKGKNIYMVKNLTLLGIILWCYTHHLVSEQELQKLNKLKIFGKTIDFRKLI